MGHNRRRGAGFSLVELVIVIVIIGIIAAIAIPRVGRGARGAGESALASNLTILRNAIEFYASQHNGNYPGTLPNGTAGTPALFVDQMIKFSKMDGGTNNTFDATNGFVYGPYLRKGIPPTSVGVNRGDTNVVFDIVASPPAVTAGTEGWAYNPLTGDLIVNSDDNNEAGDQTYNLY